MTKRLILIVVLFFTLMFGLAAMLSAQVLPTPGAGKNDNSDLTTGMRFKPKKKSIVSGLRYFRDANFTGSSVGHLWDATGKMLTSATFPGGEG